MITQLLKYLMQGKWGRVHDDTDANIADNFDVAVKLQDKWQLLAPDQREALEMLQHKVGRILNGDPDYADSWRDIAGYAQLVADRLDGNAR